MKRMKQKVVSWLLIAVMICMMLPVTAFAAGDVAKIGNTTYGTLDEAVAEAADGDTIELLQDATTEGLNLSKDLTIQAAAGLVQKPTVTFTEDGIALWGKALTFKNCNVVMNGIGGTPYVEWKWMSICASTDASLTLDNVNMTMDAEGVSNSPHAIYFCNNNILNLVNGTNLTIKNYPQDALEWDGGDGGYNVNITDSTFVSDHNRSGFTGTFYATITDSNVDVINSTGNGSNGSHFVIKNSKVNFSNNGSHGLSAGNLVIDDNAVVDANNNGICGIIASGHVEMNNSIVNIKENEVNCEIKSGWSRPGALCLSGDSEIGENCKITISDNKGSGIYLWGNATLDMKNGIIQRNNAEEYGGGIYNEGNCTLSEGVRLYNNHANVAADDIYNSEIEYVYNNGDYEEVESGAQISFGKTGRGWSLDGGEDCNGEEHLIDGWYDDSEEARWEAHAETEEENHIEKFEEFDEGTRLATVTDLKALKAAHGKEAEKKTSYPGLDKTVEGGDETSVAAGETIEFKLESNVPEDLMNYLEPDPVASPSVSRAFANPENGGKYELKFHDIMDEELSLNEGSFVVKVGDTSISEELYEVIVDPEDSCTFEISMDLVQLYKEGIITQEDFGETPIVVTYTATAKEDIIHGTYYNTAWVEYEKGESEEDTVTVYTYQLEIFKYDQSTDEGLGGARFELYQKDENGDVIQNSVRELMSGADGYVTVEGLDEGTYYLKETEAPEGFVCSEEELTIAIPDQAGADQIIKVRFANSNIPHTGGTGTRMYTIGGAAIIAAAGLLLVVSRRKKEDK